MLYSVHADSYPYPGGFSECGIQEHMYERFRGDCKNGPRFSCLKCDVAAPLINKWVPFSHFLEQVGLVTCFGYRMQWK